MGAGRGVPDRDRPERAGIVSETDHTQVTRLSFPGHTVIRKRPLGPKAGDRLAHETGILQRLRGVEGLAQLVDRPRYPDSIVLADAGTASLAEQTKPLAVDEVIGLATALAGAVAGMHRCGVTHRDISPANIVVYGDGAPTLVDFALAASAPELRLDFTHATEIVGTLAYLAPEATGRTGRSVDQRADLYALGATLYELATGRPPFGSGDPLRLTHDHLARVPVPPAEVNPAVPGALSRIILHLLEKDPDHRYQSADGLLHDLERLQDADAQVAQALRVGEHDLPPLLLPPSRLVGRDTEVAALREAFDDALAGRCRVVLVGGAPGVGKTVLVDQLRPVVTGSDGWFVAGKFDQYRRDLEFDGVAQAFRALGRLLLAESESELTAIRERLLAALGPNAGLASAVIPEFAALLAVLPDGGDPLTAQTRAQRNAVEILRAVASRKRPVVFFVDDLQWAGRTPLGLFDLVLSEEPIEGLLLVGAYRGGDVDAAHTLASISARAPDRGGVWHLQLDNLPVPSLAGMVAEMLHAEPATAAQLARMIGPHTAGNPYETVELLDALRRARVLTPTARSWQWDDAAVRAHLGEAAGTLSAARITVLPPQSRAMVEAMACLGGQAETSLLQSATGQPAAMVEHAVAPALQYGLLVAEPTAHPAVRFRHDRLREDTLAGLDPARRHDLYLGMARRLADAPDLFAVAAEQYLPVVDTVEDPTERRRVVRLLRRAAEQARLIGDHARVNTLLDAALPLIDPDDAATLASAYTGRHAALYSLGRLDEADEDYRAVERLPVAAVVRADATAVQVRSLTHRKHFPDPITLGLGALRQLGIAVPAADRIPADLENQFGHLYRWLDSDEADDLTQPELTDPAMLAATQLINAILPAAYFIGDLPTVAWLSLEALRIWLDHGPNRTLLGPAGHGAFATVAMLNDRAAGYRAVRRIVALGEARGYAPDTSQARFLFALMCCWFEPIENGVEALRRARQGLIAGGDLANAGYTYHAAVPDLLDCAPSLDACAAEIDEGVAFARRMGNEQSAQWVANHRWLVAALRGESSAAAGKPIAAESYADNPPALLHAYVSRAIAAAILGDPEDLDRHTAAAMPLEVTGTAFYISAVARMLRGLALAWQAQAAADAGQRDRLVAELEGLTRWLAARAADAPENFSHLVRLLEAERAWAVGDSWAATLAFDAARHEVSGRQRPWHRALITERAARLHLGQGLGYAGHALLAEAHQHYAAWGATAKVGQLDWAYPTLHPEAETTTGRRGGPAAIPSHQRVPVTTGAIDLLGILSASQALSSETRLDRLHARVVEVLGALSGATAVHLLLRDDDRQDWLLPTPTGTMPIGSAARDRGTPVGRALRPARWRAAGRGRRHRRRPLRPRPLPRRRTLLLDAGRPHPQPRHPARRAAAGKPPSPKRLHRRAAGCRQAHRRPARRLARQRPALRRTDRVPHPNRRRRRHRTPPHRTRPARRRPAAAGLARPAAARRRAHGEAGSGPTPRPRSCTRPPTSSAACWTTCVRSPAASTPPPSPTAG